VKENVTNGADTQVVSKTTPVRKRMSNCKHKGKNPPVEPVQSENHHEPWKMSGSGRAAGGGKRDETNGPGKDYENPKGFAEKKSSQEGNRSGKNERRSTRRNAACGNRNDITDTLKQDSTLGAITGMGRDQLGQEKPANREKAFLLVFGDKAKNDWGAAKSLLKKPSLKEQPIS